VHGGLGETCLEGPVLAWPRPLMPSLCRSKSRALLCAATALLAAVAACLLVRLPLAHATSASQLQRQISAGQSRISGLSGKVAAADKRLGQLRGGISGLEARISALQQKIAPELAREAQLRVELARARHQLTQLEALESHAEAVLAKQLVGTYESDQPDLVTAILDAKGFQDLLDRIAYVSRVQHQDAQVVKSVRATRVAVATQATHLGALEAHLQAITATVLAQRNALIKDRLALVRQETPIAQSRNATAAQLQRIRSQVGGLQSQLSKIVAAQAAQAARASGVSAPSGFSGSVQVSSSGGFVFPLPKSAASPPGSWSPDQGVDISAPGDTPELAVCSGTIVLHGIGGFGPWAPVLHCDGSISGYSYVYYGHAGPADQLPIGTHVSAGQVMSSIGPGIVGISTGPHLEIGFCDASGSPIGPQTAGTMMSLLQAAYAG
jgi:murein DD-endopeptidase MepM/ murein hydrolase activator NlpD